MVYQVVSGMSANSKRTDKNLVERIQRNAAKIENASNGNWGDRKRNQEYVEGASTKVEPVSMPKQTTNPYVSSVNAVNAFQQGGEGFLSHGAKGGPGDSDSIQQTMVGAPNPSDLLARAMLLANPDSIHLLAIVQALNAERRNAAGQDVQ